MKFHCMHNNLRILPQKRDLSYEYFNYFCPRSKHSCCYNFYLLAFFGVNMIRFVIALSIRLSTYKTIVQNIENQLYLDSIEKPCSIFWLQGWRNVARDNLVDLLSVVTSPDKHSLPKFNPLFLNAVSFGGRNTPTPIQTKRKPIF